MKNTKELTERVLRANLSLVESGLVKLTWGNASAVNRSTSQVFIKPSGVDYEIMDVASIVEIDLVSGRTIGHMKPSSDTPTHLYLYRAFPEIGAVVHTHSPWATIWAQACRPIPCLGTTHADHFYGQIPVTRRLSPDEISGDYEYATGVVIAETFKKVNPLDVPGVLVAEHGPFTWGKTVEQAVQHAVILEEIARMAYHTIQLGKESPIQQGLLDKHYLRKHGPGAYYGQEK